MKLFSRQKPLAGRSALGGSGDFRAGQDEGPIELTTMIGYLTRAVPEDWTTIHEVCDHASSSESNAKEAIRAVRRELRSGDPPVQLSAARLWAIMLRNSSDMFISESASRKFLDTLEELLQGKLSQTSPVVRERLLEVVAAAAYASSSKADPELGLKSLWRRFKPFDKPDEPCACDDSALKGVPFDKDDPIFGPSMLGGPATPQTPMVEHQGVSPLPGTHIPTLANVQESEGKINARGEQEFSNQERVPDEGPADLTRMIRYFATTASEDWTLVLDICDCASSNESNAKEAIRALRHEFKNGEPPAQLSAARLWAIMLRNSSDTFISQSTSRKFLDTLEDLLQSSQTSPVVRERLLEVVAAAAYASGAKKDPRNRDGFKGLWRRVKPFDKPEEGVPFDTDDAMFNPPVLGRLSGYEVPMVQDQEATPLVGANTNPSTSANTAAPGDLTLGPQPQYSNPSQTVEKKASPAGATGNRIIVREDIWRLFQECSIGQGNASLLSQALALSKPEDLEKKSMIKEFHAKCCSSQEFIFAQIPWASAGAERSRVEANSLRMASGNGNGHASKRTISNNDLAVASGGESGAQERENGDASPTDADETVEEKVLAALLLANEELMEVLQQYDDLVRIAQGRKAEERSRREARRALKQQQQQLQREYSNGNTAVPMEQSAEQQQYEVPSRAESPSPSLSYQPAPLTGSLSHIDHTPYKGDYQPYAGPAPMPQPGQQQQPNYLQAVSFNSTLQRDPSGTDDTILDPPVSGNQSDQRVPTAQHREGASSPSATPPSDHDPDADETLPPRYSNIFPDVRRSWHRLAGWRTSIRQQREKG